MEFILEPMVTVSAQKNSDSFYGIGQCDDCVDCSQDCDLCDRTMSGDDW